MKYNNFYDAFNFLNNHPIFKGDFQYGCLDVMVVKVNPETNSIDGNRNLNTKTNVWLECGELGYHDYELDCGAETYEEAIVELAGLVLNKYGDYEEPEITKEDMEEVIKSLESLGISLKEK